MIFLLITIMIMITVKYIFFWKPIKFIDFYGTTPILFAHRGTPDKIPENTSSSFGAAIKKGFKAIEVDVCSTLDGQVVCTHNFDLERETEGKGFVDENNYRDIQNVKTKSRSSKYNKESIPLLIDMARTLPINVLVNIEIKTKNMWDIGTAVRVAKLIRTGRIVQKVIVSSFNPLVLFIIKMLERKTGTGFLFYETNKLWLIKLLHFDCIHPEGGVVTRDIVKKAHKRGQAVNVWTVDSVSGKKWLEKINVDGIITNYYSDI